MHIGLYSPHWPPSRGANGIVSYVEQVRGHFLSRGHDVSVIAEGALISSDDSVTPLRPQGGAAKVLDQIGSRIAWRTDRSSGALAPAGRQVARDVAAAHRIRRFDVFEMEESFGWSSMVGRALDVPVVTRLHGPQALMPSGLRTPDEARRQEARCAAETRAIRGSAMITSPTWAILERICAKSGRAIGEGSQVIANPIEVAPDLPCWRYEDCDPDHILAIGRFDFWKGADTLLLAFERLLQSRPEARLTLVGPDEGIETAPGVRVGFEAFVQANLQPRTRARITFTGRLERAEVARLRLDAMVTVCASRWETFSYVLVEGMAAGCPLISTDWPASAEVIIDGKSGIRTRVGDPELMAAAMERVLGNPLMAVRMGGAARKRCEELFATTVVGDQLLDCYRSIIDRHARQ